MSSIEPDCETRPRHVKVSGRIPMFGYERCEDDGCVVGLDGVASSCGRTACPECGSGGANLTAVSTGGGKAAAVLLECTCGNSWAAPGSITPFSLPALVHASHDRRVEHVSWL